jgi:RimJ/RimL family protein N-acetyltransferase
VPAPPLETARLVLRGHRMEDLGDCLSMWSDPLVVRHVGGKPLSEEEVWGKLLRNVGHWSLVGYGYWVVTEKGSGRFVGEVGFANFKRQLSPPIHGVPEAGWVLSRHAHGKGYATEAMAAAYAWHHGRYGPQRTVCIIDPQNAPSFRVAEKLGFQKVTQTLYRNEPVVLMERAAT